MATSGVDDMSQDAWHPLDLSTVRFKPKDAAPPVSATPAAEAAESWIGRAAELDLLTAALDAVATGGPHAAQVIVVRGSEGVGKTGLLRCFAAGVAARGRRPPAVLALRVNEDGARDCPWLGFRTPWFEAWAWAALPSLPPSLRPHARLLGAIVPALVAAPAFPGEAPREEIYSMSSAARSRAVGDLALFVLGHGLAALDRDGSSSPRDGPPSPAVILADDASGLDDDSLELLADLVAESPCPVLAVAVMCEPPGEASPPPALLTLAAALKGAEVPTSQLRLAPLPPSALERMLCSLLGAATLDPPVRALLAVVVEPHFGNLLHMRELAAVLLAGAYIAVDASTRAATLVADPTALLGGVAAPGGDANDSLLSPGAFGRLVQARVARLPPTARAAVAAGACLGTEDGPDLSSPAVCRTVAEWSGLPQGVPESESWTRVLVTAGIWEFVPAGVGGRRLQFAHSAYRRAIYGGLLASERAALAARGPRPSADERNPAGRRLLLPIEREGGTGPETPRSFSVTATARATSSAQEALYHAGLFLLGAGDLPSSEHALARASAVAVAAEDSAVHVQAASTLTLHYFLGGRLEEALHEADRLVAWAAAFGCARGALVGQLDRLRVLLAMGDAARAAPLQALVESRLAAVSAAGERPAALGLQSLLLWCRIAAKSYAAAATDLAALLATVASAPRSIYTTFALLGTLHGMLNLAEAGVLATGRVFADDVAAAVSSLESLAGHFPLLEPRARLMRAALLRFRGDGPGAAACLESALSQAESRGLIFEQALAHWELRRFAPGGTAHLVRSRDLFQGNRSLWAEARCVRAMADPAAFGVEAMAAGGA